VASSISTISLANTCVGSSVPKKFNSNNFPTASSCKSKKDCSPSLCTSSSDKHSWEVVAPGALPPAPLINILHSPTSAFILSCTSSSFFLPNTSPLQPTACPPAASIFSTTSLIFSSFLASTTTFAPACANA